MKKICLLLSLVFVLTQTSAFAEYSYHDYINEINPNIDTSGIYESNIIHGLFSCDGEEFFEKRYKNGEYLSDFFLWMPIKNSNDFYVATWRYNDYEGTYKNINLFKPVKNFDKSKALAFAKENGLGNPNTVEPALFYTLGMFAYFMTYDDQDYIIPYYYFDDTQYNPMQNDECKLEIGKAYSLDEFIKIRNTEIKLRFEYNREKDQERLSQTEHIIYDSETGAEEDIYFPDGTKKNNDTDTKLDKEKNNASTGKKDEENKTNGNNKTDKTDNAETKKDENKTADTKKADEKTDIKLIDPSEKNIGQDKFFNDVPPDHWAYDDIMTLAKNNVILGYGNNYFGVNDSVTNEQLALLLKRQFDYDEKNTSASAAKRENIIVSLIKALNPDLSKVDTSVIAADFSDGNSINEIDKPYIAYAVENKIVLGDNSRLNLENNVTRAETAALINRALKLK